jgi:hypothetical protein
VDGSRRALVDATRVAPGEYGAAIERLLESRDEGGPDVVFVRTPERIAVTLAQLEAIAARARDVGVDRLIGPRRLLSPVAPALPDCDLVGRRLDVPEGSAIVFGAEEATDSVALADVDSTVVEMRDWLRNLERMRSRLPDDSLREEDLFGDAPAHRVFADNCHLTPEGARLAGEALAREILRRRPSR